MPLTLVGSCGNCLAMADKILLDAVERRVLGVLMEKSLAQPDYYPMTLNALVAGCNQKQNRDPVTSLDDSTIHETLEALRQRNLVTLVFPAPGARTERFKHDVQTVFGWQPRERAIMTELLLRGPQTMGELRTRCSRFMPFDDLEAVTLVLDCLAKYDPPAVAPMPREPGRSAIRYTHLLYPEDERPVAETEALTPAAVAPRERSAVSGGALDELRATVAKLEQTVADLTTRLETIERQLL